MPTKCDEQAVVRQRVQLPLHRFLLIEEPPAAAELDLARDAAVLEIPDHRRERVVVGRVQVVDDRLRQRVVLLEAIEIPAERVNLRQIADRVVAGVAAERLQRARVRVAARAEVQLLRPALLGVEMAEEHHDVRRERLALLGRRGLSGARLVEDRFRLSHRCSPPRSTDRGRGPTGGPRIDGMPGGACAARRADPAAARCRRSRSSPSLSIHGLNTSG